MIRFALLLSLLALIAMPAFADEESGAIVTLDKMTLDLGKLEEWGMKQYTYRLVQPDGKTSEVLGTFVLSTKVENGAVILKDEIAITYKGKRLSGKTTLHCRSDNHLSPLRIDSKGEGDDEIGTFTATVKEGKALVTINGRERTVDLPGDTVTSEALMRLVTIVPVQKGNRISIGHSLETSELNLKKDYLLESQGEETIDRDGQEIRCTKFQLTSKQIRPMYLWVKDGVLERMLLDDRKLIDRVEQNGAGVEPTNS